MISHLSVSSSKINFFLQEMCNCTPYIFQQYMRLKWFRCFKRFYCNSLYNIIYEQWNFPEHFIIKILHRRNKVEEFWRPLIYAFSHFDQITWVMGEAATWNKKPTIDQFDGGRVLDMSNTEYIRHAFDMIQINLSRKSALLSMHRYGIYIEYTGR